MALFSRPFVFALLTGGACVCAAAGLLLRQDVVRHGGEPLLDGSARGELFQAQRALRLGPWSTRWVDQPRPLPAELSKSGSATLTDKPAGTKSTVMWQTLLGSPSGEPRLAVSEEFSPQVDRWSMVWRSAAGPTVPGHSESVPDARWETSPLFWAAYLRLTGASDQPLSRLWTAPVEVAVPVDSPTRRAGVLRALSLPDFGAQLMAPCPDGGADLPRTNKVPDWALLLPVFSAEDWTLRGCSNAAGMNLWAQRSEAQQSEAQQSGAPALPDNRSPGVGAEPFDVWLRHAGWTISSFDSIAPEGATDAGVPEAATEQASDRTYRVRLQIQPPQEASGQIQPSQEASGQIQPSQEASRLRPVELRLFVERGALTGAELMMPGDLKSAHWELIRELAWRQQADGAALVSQVRAQLASSCVAGVQAGVSGTVRVWACADDSVQRVRLELRPAAPLSALP